MEEIIQNSYPFEPVFDNDMIRYDFVSQGEKEIAKRVFITRYPNVGLERYFNLGFANVTVDELGAEFLSDTDRKNNRGDEEKTLSTVLTCAVEYLSRSNDSILTFYGNTSSKHRLYKMRISGKLKQIQEYFIVKGATIPDLQVETINDVKNPQSPIDFRTIIYEDYNVKNSGNYSFITFELRDELKTK